MNLAAIVPKTWQPAPRVLGNLNISGWIPGGQHDKIDIHLSSDEYKNVAERDAARMLGYFTQKLQDAGFPWSLYDCTVDGEKVTSGKAISEIEALRKLRNNEHVLFQPMRNLQLNLSSESLGALAAAGAVGGQDMTHMTRVANFTKTAQVSPGSQGYELKFGAPVVVSTAGQLKLLYEMYNPEVKINENNAVGKAAHQLSYFTKETMGSPYPWRFFKESTENKIVRMARAAVPGLAGGALVGAGIGGMLGAPIALFTGNWTVAKTLATYGGMIGGAYKFFDSARTAAKGTPINAVEALSRVLDGQGVIFQETTMRSVGVPIIGKISWFSDHGEGSVISNPAELDTFFWMQNQAAKMPGTDPKKEEPKPAPPQVIVIQDNRSYEQTNLDVYPTREPRDRW
ncbi:MAG: hypothetical protein FJX76_08095 [Armatimonadetes bacterium]|nr:hypothetical protein [Armatimonadota bacterium]